MEKYHEIWHVNSNMVSPVLSEKQQQQQQQQQQQNSIIFRLLEKKISWDFKGSFQLIQVLHKTKPQSTSLLQQC